MAVGVPVESKVMVTEGSEVFAQEHLRVEGVIVLLKVVVPTVAVTVAVAVPEEASPKKLR